jgi:hypothetical protein
VAAVVGHDTVDHRRLKFVRDLSNFCPGIWDWLPLGSLGQEPEGWWGFVASASGLSLVRDAEKVETGSPPRGCPRRYVFMVVALVAAFYAAVAISNFALNPLAYNATRMQSVAETMAAGKNFATYDPNINWRALRREQIEVMTATPDVVVFGGSRWQEAYAELLPGSSVFNAHVHSDYAEDFLALVQLLDEHGRLPDTLVLSLRYIIFEPVAKREPTDWREWTFEYRRMAHRLGIDPHPVVDTLPVSHWTALFSVPDLVDRVELVAGQSEESGPTTDLVKDTLDVIGADGSLRWSRENLRRFTPQFALKDAQAKVKSNWNARPAIDRGLVDAVEKLIAYLQAKGVRVVFAQTPFHPAFYEAVEARPFGAVLGEVEQIARGWVDRYGVTVVGGFDPRRVGCPVEQFIDWHHAKPECLGNILKTVPWLA